MSKSLRIYLIVVFTLCLVGATLLLSSCANDEHVHSYGEWEETAAKCEIAGQRMRTCSECGDVETEPIEKLGHDWEKETIETETCQRGGKYLYSCKRADCGASKTETTSPVDHKWIFVNRVEATCVGTGSVTYRCDFGCNTPRVDTLKPIGHNFSNSYTVDEQPSYEKEGSQSKHCTRSGCNQKSDVQAVPRLQATYTVTVKDPCGSTYYGSATVVFYVNGVLKEQVTIASNQVATITLNSPNCNVKITGLNKGYYADESGYDISAEQPTLTVRLGASLNEDKTIWHQYHIGDIMYNEVYTYYVGEDSTATISTSEILSSKKGILMNFYFDGCSPCNSEMAALIEVANQYKDEVAVLMLNIQYESEALIKSFRKRNNAVDSPLYFLTETSNKKAFQDFIWNMKSAPWSAFIDCNGQIIYWQVGAMSKSAFQLAIQRYILDRYDILRPSTEKANNNSATIGNFTTIAIIPSKKFGF